jgi:uncharacterized protein YndB with AHSA1/START domain
VPAPRHVFQTYIRATPDAVWQAITDPEFTRRYFHRTAIASSFAPGAPVRYVLPDGTDAVAGEVQELEPGRRLVMSWRVLYDAALADEPPSTVEWVITPGVDGVTKVTTIHRDLALSPGTSTSVGDGWPWILDSLKSLLETGAALEGAPPTDPGGSADADSPDEAEGVLHRRLAVGATNAAWELLGRDERTPDDVDDLLGRAYAAAYHWRRAAGAGPEHAARAAWLVSHAHAVIGHGEAALHHADRVVAITTAAGLADFDRAYAHEARARALACVGRTDEAMVELAAAHAVPIVDPDDRAVLLGDLAAEPWYGVPAVAPAAT